MLNAIEELGNQAVRISFSNWYVRTTLSAGDAATRVWDVMQAADLLLVVNASSNEAAMFNVDTRASHFVAERWHLDTSFSERRLRQIGFGSQTGNEAHDIREASG